MGRIDFTTTESMKSPTSCPMCQDIFMKNKLLQKEILHIAKTEGDSAAKLELNDRLEEEHASHGP